MQIPCRWWGREAVCEACCESEYRFPQRGSLCVVMASASTPWQSTGKVYCILVQIGHPRVEAPLSYWQKLHIEIRRVPIHLEKPWKPLTLSLNLRPRKSPKLCKYSFKTWNLLLVSTGSMPVGNVVVRLVCPSGTHISATTSSRNLYILGMWWAMIWKWCPYCQNVNIVWYNRLIDKNVSLSLTEKCSHVIGSLKDSSKHT